MAKSQKPKVNSKTAKQENVPETKRFQLSREEILELENISLKMEMLKKNQNEVVQKAVNRVGEKLEQLQSLNPQTGEMVFLGKSEG